MEINLFDLMEKPKLLHPQEAQEGAKRLLERTRSGDMGMEVMPNTYAQFTGELEEKHFISYCDFLSSASGRKVIGLLEEEDERKLSEL